MVELPAELTFGHVAGRYILIVADTISDPDAKPDAVAEKGSITFTPVVSQIISTSNVPTSVSKAAKRFKLDAEGYLSDDHGNQTVQLVTGAYKVTYALGSVRHDPHMINVVEENTAANPVWLPISEPYQPPPNTVVNVLPLPSGGQVGQVYGWTGTGVGWYTPEAGPSMVMAVIAPATTRPTTATDVTVLWIGYNTKPDEFVDAVDLYFSTTGTVVVPPDPPDPPDPTGDTTNPSVPTGLATSNITATSVQLSWSAATDNVAVTGYETSTNGTTWTNRGNVLTYTFTGLTAATGYTLRVRAIDAAGNRSTAATIAATTSAGGGGTPTEHNIFGSGVPTELPVHQSDGTPSIITANAFYTTAGAEGWRCVGGRLYVPAGSPAIGQTLTLRLHESSSTSTTEDLGVDLSSGSLREGQVVAQAGWNEVRWTPYVKGVSLPRMWIAATFGNGNYMYIRHPDSGFVPSPTAGNKVVFSEVGTGGGARAKYRIGTGNTSSATQPESWYGIDIIMDGGA